MSNDRDRLAQAIQEFPAIAWLSEHTQVFDRGGRNVYAVCPLCSDANKQKPEKTLALWRENKLFHCFKCDEGQRCREIWNGKANLVQMICILEKISIGAAIEKIFKDTGMPDPPRFKKSEPKKLLPDNVFPLTSAASDHPAVVWTLKRAPHLLESSYVTVGSKYDGRVIFPTYYFGEVTGFEAKTYSNQKPKSVFPDWFDTYTTFYTTKRWEPDLDVMIITESLVDAETLGINCIGVYGSSLKDGQLTKLLTLANEKKVKELVWMLDGDAWAKQIKIIYKKTIGIFNNSVIKLPNKLDPNELGFQRAWEYVHNRVRIRDEFDLVALDLQSL